MVLRVVNAPLHTKEVFEENESGQRHGLYKLVDKNNNLIEKRMYSFDRELWSLRRSKERSIFSSLSGLNIIKNYDNKGDISEIMIFVGKTVAYHMSYYKKARTPWSVRIVSVTEQIYQAIQQGSIHLQSTHTVKHIGTDALSDHLGMLKSWPKIIETEVEEIVEILFNELTMYYRVS